MLSTHRAQWNLSLCSHHVFHTQGTMEPQPVQSPCFPHTGHNGTSACAVTMFPTHRAQWNLSLYSHHAFYTQGTMEPQTVQSPCLLHTGHSPVSHSWIKHSGTSTRRSPDRKLFQWLRHNCTQKQHLLITEHSKISTITLVTAHTQISFSDHITKAAFPYHLI